MEEKVEEVDNKYLNEYVFNEQDALATHRLARNQAHGACKFVTKCKSVAPNHS